MPKPFKRRNNLKMSVEELDSYFEILANSFNEEWLERKGDNPIQHLWQRNEELSTNELYTLATAIKKLMAINPAWTNDQLKKARNFDKNNRMGAICELLTLNLLHSEKYPVIPAKRNQAGYDAILKVQNKEMRISIKRYGMSIHQQKFETQTKSIEKQITSILEKYKYPPCQVLLDFPHNYPNEEDWNIVKKHLDYLFEIKRDDPEPFSAIARTIDPTQPSSPNNTEVIAILIIDKLKDTSGFHLDYRSYSLIVSSVYHPNEYLNIFDKIEKSSKNLTRHSANQNETTINALFLHVPNSISLNNCWNWLNEYFKKNPEQQIALVFLYQASIDQEIKDSKTILNHCIKIFQREEMINLWLPKGTHFKFEVPVGVISNETSTPQIHAHYPDGRTEIISADNRYLFQRGNHYMKMEVAEDGTMRGNITKVGRGIYTNVVVELPGQPGSFILSNKFPVDDELLIM